MGPRRERRSTALFTKHPTPGEVKTRLCPPLSPEGAARLAEGMLRDAAARCAALEHRAVLVFAPPEQAAWFRASFPELPHQVPQQGAGLGERLANFVRAWFAAEPETTLVVIGSDQPLVPPARIQEAHDALEGGARCVLGPDQGGGYYLIGLRQPSVELFLDVRMSAAGMCAATQARARAAGLAVRELPVQSDVDNPADLEALCAALAGPTPSIPASFLVHTRRALDALATTP